MHSIKFNENFYCFEMLNHNLVLVLKIQVSFSINQIEMIKKNCFSKFQILQLVII